MTRECQVCMSTNDAYCVDETSYYLCLDGKNPSKAQLHQCDEGHVCTTSENICEPKKGANNVVNNPVCGSSCNKCPTTGRYTCVSKTQFGRCVNGAITIVSACEKGQICSADLYEKTGAICAPQCVADFYEVTATCGNADLTTTTTTVAPIDVGRLKEQCTAAEADHPDDISYFIRNADDEDCTTYIYCEKFDDGIDALLMICKNGYFNLIEEKCQSEQPEDCSASGATTVPTI
ncbi:uncharacterized protein LOC133332732 [Musca vetustissima]|uniref:uncharacterized protein LOC133332732 n=1 Tax=Musca vetustissima TaxID=27455 RepID=UPI002AB6946F|nr:uncharacterized protein LOC133332732 [Musca vetustissima]